MNWVDAVTKDLNPEIAPLVAVIDPDGIFREEAVLAAVQARGYAVVQFEDEIQFRVEFEAKFRGREDRHLLIVHHGGRREDLPYDLVSAATVVSASLPSLFPNLSYPVLRGLDPNDLPVLFGVQQAENPSRMNDGETKKFALLHVYGIVPELLRSPADLLRELLRLHHAARTLPPVLANWLVERLKVSGGLSGYPLDDIVTDRSVFFSFLQRRWTAFLYKLARLPLPESIEPLPDVPFDHPNVRVYIDNLFIDGTLSPVEFPYDLNTGDEWVQVGVAGAGDEGTRNQDRLARLLPVLEHDVPDEDARARAWTAFAYRWAEASVLWHRLNPATKTEFASQFQGLQNLIDDRFERWLTLRYSGLHSQPPVPPAVLHHVPRSMARRLEDRKARKAALLVLDGLALDQWLLLKDAVVAAVPTSTTMVEEAVFAWIPTLTSVSRQALFSGRPPIQFAGSIATTAKEKAQWLQFWMDHGYTSKQVEYRKGLGVQGDLLQIEELASNPNVKVVGLVVDKIDKIMHGMELGMGGMHNQIDLWARSGYLSALVKLLLDNEFHIVITSDHGNVEASGIGRPSEGAIAEERGERVRTYSSQLLREQMMKACPTAVQWAPVGLPADYLPLLARGRDAFVPAGEVVVGHGGASIEEVIVPFIRIEGL
ncbi:BREX-3 system phosphatase PglZ [Azospirillum canadense]|uniref:BREX-3 system phosphatase PglZ n=1 Tax=Azospirillum canadense TaxID=403962 RepID=UPI0022277714|nr:BREX-3 system phosphatase PglZ [Azospirillum canadense]MCW2238226.1 hypothetical protein [Azospirillum canadense]